MSDTDPRPKIVRVIKDALKTYTRKGTLNNYFSRHVKKALRAEFGDKPTIIVNVEAEHNFHKFEVSMWNTPGAEGYDKRIEMSTSFGWSEAGLLVRNDRTGETLEDGKGWEAKILESIERYDTTDHNERVEDEKALYTELDEIEAEIKWLKARAAKLVEDLPIPKAATVRKDAVHWKTPTSGLREKYPLSFAA